MGGGRRSIRITLLLNAAGNHRSNVRLAEDDLRLGPLFREHPRHALESAPGAESRHPVIQSFALEVFHNFPGCCS